MEVLTTIAAYPEPPFQDGTETDIASGLIHPIASTRSTSTRWLDRDGLWELRNIGAVIEVSNERDP